MIWDIYRPVLVSVLPKIGKRPDWTGLSSTSSSSPSAPAPGLPLDVTPIAPDPPLLPTRGHPPPASAVLVCHVSQYLTRTHTYLSISVLFIISVSLPYPQEDPYPFLFGSPARYVLI